jgi:hypothetical protein
VNKIHRGSYRNGAISGTKKGCRLFYQLLPIVVLLLFACALEPQHAWPEVPFKNEFDNICSRTMDAATLSVQELETLITLCDKLQPVIEKAGEPENKIYLKRLRMCKDLFVYVLEVKKAAGTADK